MVDKKSPRMHNNPYRSRGSSANVSILLTCGHRITTRLEPLSKTSKYACSAKEGCGYRLEWVEYSIVGREGVFKNKDRGPKGKQ